MEVADEPKKELAGGGEGKAYDSIERDFQEVRACRGPGASASAYAADDRPKLPETWDA